ncbi:MAG: hypothetical protein IKN11_01625 [Bacteroidales bacterium]|nr:hypothetical protein [Bacteroidales bacterium]
MQATPDISSFSALQGQARPVPAMLRGENLSATPLISRFLSPSFIILRIS